LGQDQPHETGRLHAAALLLGDFRLQELKLNRIEILLPLIIWPRSGSPPKSAPCGRNPEKQALLHGKIHDAGDFLFDPQCRPESFHRRMKDLPVVHYQEKTSGSVGLKNILAYRTQGVTLEELKETSKISRKT